MLLLIAYVVLALGVSFLCSVMEAVLLSISPSYAATLAAQGTRTGLRLKALKDDIDRPLAAILSLNTIAHTVGAAGAGAQAASVFGNQYLGAASAVLTLLILVLSEIIPKTLGALYWRPLTRPVVRLLRWTILSMWPLVKMAKWMTKLLSRNHEKVTIRRQEFAMLAKIGVEEGEIHEEESRMLQSLFRFGELQARDIMTPRTVVVAARLDQTVAEALAVDKRFSRLPVVGKGIDDVRGFVRRADLLERAVSGEGEGSIEPNLRGLIAIPDQLGLREVFERLTRDRTHIALVVDEYGGTAGLVTLEDVIETLLGLEITDEVDTVTDMQALARRQWKARARKIGLISEDPGAE